MRIRAWVVAAIALAVVAALFTQDRPGAPRGLSAGPAAAYLATQLATLGYGPAGDNGTYFQDVAILERVHDGYNERRYQQPSDEFQPNWNYAGAVQDMRLLAELAWRLASDPLMPAYNPNEQFARVRK